MELHHHHGITYQCGFHTGCDFPASGTSESNPDLYSCVEDGEVVYTYTQSTGSTPSLGNQVQIKDNQTGYYYRYCHMLYNSIKVNVGDKVNTGTILGKMGTTRSKYRNSFTLRINKNGSLEL